MPLGKLRIFYIRCFSKTESNPAKTITGQCLSTEMKAACKNSANLEQETKTTKIVTSPLFPLASSYWVECMRSSVTPFAYLIHYLGNQCRYWQMVNGDFIFHGILCNTPKKSRGTNLIIVPHEIFTLIFLKDQKINLSSAISCSLNCRFLYSFKTILSLLVQN